MTLLPFRRGLEARTVARLQPRSLDQLQYAQPDHENGRAGQFAFLRI